MTYNVLVSSLLVENSIIIDHNPINFILTKDHAKSWYE